MSTRFEKLYVTNIKKLTEDCVAISLEIPTALKQAFSYIQGQYITVKKTIENQEVRRSYSICSSPLENSFTIAVKKIEGGIFSTYANTHLKVGDCLEVMAPKGKFFTLLNSNNKKRYVAIAAGSGITPIISIIKTTLLTEPNSHFILVFGNKNSRSIIFREELENLKNKFTNRLSIIHILSRENTDSPIHFGRINEDKCSLLFGKLVPLHADEYFICGPQEMIFSVKSFLEQNQVDANKIHYELFAAVKGKQIDNATNTIVNDQRTSKIHITIDGRTISFQLQYNHLSILDAALQNGADLPFACKGGVCCTCKAKLVNGNVTMHNNYALEQEEIQQGYILTCQATPTTETVTINFDEK